MKRIVVMLLAASILFATAPSVSAKTIKIGTIAPTGSVWYEAIRDMAEAWTKASGGEIDFKIYAGGVAGDEPDLVRKMRIGQLHAAILTVEGLADIAPEVLAVQTLMTFASNEELEYVQEHMAPMLEAIMENRGFKVLNWGNVGWARFFAKKPVVSPEDLKPLRLFLWSADDAYIEGWKAAGYHPVSLAATDMHTALQSGLIEAFATPPLAALSFQWFALAPHMTGIRWAPLPGATVITKSVWDSFPDDVKPALLAAAREAGEYLQREVRKLDDEAVEVMKKHGLVVHRVPPELVPQWERSTRAGSDKLIGSLVPLEAAAEVARLREEYRTLHQGQ